MLDPQRGFSAAWLGLGLSLLGLSSCGGTSERRNGDQHRGGESGSGAQGGRAGSESSGGAGLSGGSSATGGTSASGGSNATGGDSGNGGSSATGGTSGSAGSGPSGGGGGGGFGGAFGGAGSGGSGGGTSVSYSTCQFGSGISRYVIGRLDVEEDDCTVLILSVPGSDPFGITLPANWGVENAYRLSPAIGDCLIPATPPSGAVVATSGSGVVTTAGGMLDVDVTLTFPPGDAAAPRMVHLEAVDLDVSMSCVF